MIKATEHQYST